MSKLKDDHIKAVIKNGTRRTLPATAVRVTHYALQVEAFDNEGICVFRDAMPDTSLYALGVTRHGYTFQAAA